MRDIGCPLNSHFEKGNFDVYCYHYSNFEVARETPHCRKGSYLSGSHQLYSVNSTNFVFVLPFTHYDHYFSLGIPQDGHLTLRLETRCDKICILLVEIDTSVTHVQHTVQTRYLLSRTHNLLG